MIEKSTQCLNEKFEHARTHVFLNFGEKTYFCENNSKCLYYLKRVDLRESLHTALFAFETLPSTTVRTTDSRLVEKWAVKHVQEQNAF